MNFFDLIVQMQYLTAEQREEIYQQILKQIDNAENRITIMWPIPLEKLYMKVIILD